MRKYLGWYSVVHAVVDLPLVQIQLDLIAANVAPVLD
jgi:hypothetical protein